MMEKRDFSEMVRYFCQKVSEMDIARKYKMELLSMVTAIEIGHDQLMPKWTPVTEALPKEKEMVLITNKKGHVRCGQYQGIFEDKNYRWWWKHNTLEEVLAWMPLPEPWNNDTMCALPDYYEWVHSTDNPPLTWDELRAMVGKPVWVEIGDGSKGWVIIRKITDSGIVSGSDGFVGIASVYGMCDTWQAYRKERANENFG